MKNKQLVAKMLQEYVSTNPAFTTSDKVVLLAAIMKHSRLF